MYALKGFVINDQFVINTPGQTAVMGEMTTYSATFSQEKGYYKNDTINPDITFVSFTSATDGTAQAVPNDLRDRVLAILNWTYAQTLLGVQIYADQFLNSILTQFQSQAGTFACGNIIADGNGHWIPEWVSWTDNTLTAAGTQNQIKFWFVDQSFQAQFDDYSFVIVPPITPLDDFFKPGAAVAIEVNARTVPQMFDQITAARNNQPESIQLALTYNYYDPNNASNIVPTNWIVLIYGPQGDSIDAINDALVNYILANSAHLRPDWVQIFPDIFKRTEFIMLPLWDQFAIPNSALKTGIYATISNLGRVSALYKTMVPSIASAQVDSYLSLMANPYKDLQIAICGSTDNRNNWFELGDVYPDLISVGSTSTDFQRMSQDTQNFLLQLAQMLITAETMGPFTSIPTGFTRVTRDNILYIVMNYDNIDFLVAAKSNYTQVIPPVTTPTPAPTPSTPSPTPTPSP
jgi:hypothetical protein